MDDLTNRVQQLAELIGPNIYLQAANKIEIPFPQRDLHVRTMPAGD